MVIVRLHRFDLTFPDAVQGLVDILRAHIPISLPVLGTSFTTSDNLTSADSVANRLDVLRRCDKLIIALLSDRIYS